MLESITSLGYQRQLQPAITWHLLWHSHTVVGVQLHTCRASFASRYRVETYWAPRCCICSCAQLQGERHQSLPLGWAVSEEKAVTHSMVTQLRTFEKNGSRGCGLTLNSDSMYPGSLIVAPSCLTVTGRLRT